MMYLSTVFGQQALPYTDHFNTNNGWTFTSNNTSNWVVSSATGNPGNSMYLSQNGGLSNTYAINTIAKASKTFVLPNSPGNAVLQFDIKFRGEGTTTIYDYVNVWALPAGQTVSSATTITSQTALYGKTQLLSNYNMPTVSDSSIWFKQNLTLPNSLNGSNVDIYFEFISDVSTNNFPAPAIDNLTMVALSCGFPTSVSTSSPTTNSFLLNFTTSGASQYLVYLNDQYFTTVTGPGLISNVPSSNAYNVTVRGYCGLGDTSAYSNSATVSTLCAPLATYSMDFDAFATVVLPTCWAKVGTNGTVYNNSSFPRSGTRAFYIYSGSTTAHAMARLPELSNIAAGTHQLRFYARTSASYIGTNVEIGYLTDPLLQSSFVSLKIETLTDSYKEIIVNPPVGTPANYLAIRTTGNKSFNYIYLDDLVWEVIPSCLPPTNLNVASLTSNTATVTWTSSTSNPTSYDVYLNGVFYANTTSNNLVISGLSPTLTYSVQIKSICSPTNQSLFSNSTSISTACAGVSSFYEDFSSSTMPTCFGLVGSTGSIIYTSTNSFSGYAVNLYAGGTLKVRPVSNLAAGTHRLRFLARPYSSASNNSNVEIGYVTDPNDPSTFVLIQNVVIPFAAMNYTEYMVNIPAISNASVLAFRSAYQTGNTTYSDIFLENISYEAIPTCFTATNIVASNILANSMKVNWTGPNTNPLGYSIYINNVYHSYTTADSIILTGLQASSTLTIAVRTRCSNSDSSYFSQATSATTPCGLVTSFFQDFGSVSSAPNCFGKVGSTGTVSYGTAGAVSGVNVNVYGGAVLKLQPVSNMGAGTHRLRFYARPYISSATVVSNIQVGYLTNPNLESSFVSVGTISLPLNSIVQTEYSVNFPSGLTAQDLALKSAYVNGSSSTFSDVYIDDISWEAIPSCIIPSSLIVQKIQSSGAKVKWVAPVSPVQSYSIYLNGSYYASTTADSMVLNGLVGSTLYNVQVRSICSLSDSSTLTSNVSFTTLCTAVTSFFEDFGTTTTLATCTAKVGALGTVVNTTTGAVAGYNVNVYGGATYKLREVSNMGTGNQRLRFTTRTSSSNSVVHYLQVGYLNDANDATSFVSVQTISYPVLSTASVEHTVNYPAGLSAQSLAVRSAYVAGSTTTYSNVLIDNAYWEAVPTCNFPTNLVATLLTVNSAKVKWIAPLTPHQKYSVYLNGVYHTSTLNDSVVITGLVPSNTYSVSVRTLCTPSDSSYLSSAVSFSTLCAPVTTFFEDFGTSTSLPNCTAKVGTTGTIASTTTNAISGYSLNIYGGATFRFREVSNMNLNSNRLRFTTRTNSSNTVAHKLEVGYLTDPNTASSFVLVQTITYPISSIASSEYTVNYPAIINDRYPAIRSVYVTGSTTTYSNLVVDNVYWEKVPTCFPPTAPVSSNLTSNSVKVKWTVPAVVPSSYAVKVNGSYYATVSADSIIITGLSPITSYNITIAGICTPGDTSTYSSPITVNTPCGSMTQFYEGFGTSSVLPTCFAQYAPLSNVAIGFTNALSGFNAKISNDAVLKLNSVSNMGTSTHRLRLSMKPSNPALTGQVLLVGYLTDPNDGASFVRMDSIVYPSNLNTYKEVSFYYPQGLTYNHLAIKVGKIVGTAISSEIHVDEIYWEPRPICQVPTMLAISNIGTNGATVSFNPSSSSPSLYAVYVNGIYHATTNTNSATISNLMPNTAYQVTVAALCYPNDSTSISTNVGFTTLCNPSTITLAGACASFIGGLNCWIVSDQNNDGNTWVAYQDQVRMMTNNLAGQNNDYLISSGMTLGANQALKFKYKTDNNAEAEEMKVVLSTTGVNPADFSTVLLNNFSFATNGYLDTVVDLSAFAGQTVHVAFVIPTSTTDGSYVYIDDVCINECVPAAPGLDQALTYCISNGSADLVNDLTIANASGQFSSTNPLVQANLSGSVLNFSNLSAGTYSVNYIVQGLCSSDTMVVNITLQNPINLGANVNLIDCQTVGTKNLFSAANINLAGGTFSTINPAHTSYLNANMFNMNQSGAGNFGMYYIASNTCNTDTLQIDLEVQAVPSAGIDQSITNCISAGSMNLNTELAITNLSGYFISSNPSVQANLSGSVLSYSNLSAGTYTVQYVVNNVCLSDTMTATITLVDPINLGADVSLIDCQSFGYVNLLTSANISYGGGSFSAVNPAHASLLNNNMFNMNLSGAGNFDLYYIATNVCNTDTLLIDLEVESGTYAGADQTIHVCITNGSVNLSSALTLANVNGSYYSTTPAVNAAISGSTLNFSTLQAGTYSLLYVVQGACANDTLIATVVIEAPLNLGADVISSTCKQIGSVNLLTAGNITQLGGTFTALNPNYNGNINGSMFNFSQLPAGFYSFEYTKTVLCNTDSKLVHIDINQIPNAGADQALTRCKNAGPINLATAITLGTQGGTFSSSVPAITAALSGSTLAVSNLATGVYPIRYVVTSGCGNDTLIVSLTVNEIPNAGADQAITRCKNLGIVNLTSALTLATQGGTFSSSNAAMTAALTGSLVNLSLLNTGVYPIRYVVTSPCGNDTLLVSLTVNEIPNAGADQALTRCKSAGPINLATAVTLGTVGGVFSSTNPAITAALSGTTLTIANLATGVYPIRYVVSSGCGNDTMIVSLTINELPNAGADQAITRCKNSGILNLNTALTLVTQGGTYSSTNTALTAAMTGSLVNLSVLNTGVYPIRYVVTSPCGNDTLLVTLTVNAIPNAGADQAITRCKNAGALNLATAVTLGTPGGTFSSSNAAITAALSGTTLTVANLAVGVYPIRYVVTSGCGNDTLLVSLTINAVPNAGADQVLTRCNNSGPLNLSSALTLVTAGGTFSSTNAQLTAALYSSVVNVSALNAGVYPIRYVVTSGCGNDTLLVSLTVTAVPNAGADQAIARCNTAGPINLMNDLTLGAAGGTFSSSNAQITAGLSGSTLNITNLASGTYPIRYVVSSACGNDTMNVTLTINSVPNAGLDQSLSYCKTQLFANLANDLTLGTPGGTFTSTNAQVAAALSGSMFTFNNLNAGTYSIDYVVAGVCGNDTMNITVALAEVLNLGTDITITECLNNGQVDLMTASGITMLGGTFSMLNSNDAPYLTGSIFDFSVLGSSSYTAMYELASFCNTDTVLVNIHVIYNPTAGTDTTHQMCMNQPVNLQSLIPWGTDNTGSWYSATGQSVNTLYTTPNTGGTVVFTYVINSTSCGADTAMISLQVLSTCDYLGVETANFDDATAHPNPTSDKVTITLSNNSEGYKYTVMDVNGRVIYQTQEFHYDQSFDVDLSEFNDGVYVVHLINDQHSKLFRVVKK